MYLWVKQTVNLYGGMDHAESLPLGCGENPLKRAKKLPLFFW